MEIRNKKILVIIPTYNEKENISIIIEKIFSLNLNLHILVIDDDSEDQTSKEVKKLQVEYEKLHLILRKSKLGLASAYVEGFSYALKNQFDSVIQMDADLSHDPIYISKMLSCCDKYDLIIGSRYIEGGETIKVSIQRILLSRFSNLFIRLLLSIPIKDVTSGFKIIKKETLEQINFSTIKLKGYVFQVEIIYRVFMKGLKILEYPIIFQGRQKGKSKISFLIIVEAGIAILKKFFLILKRTLTLFFKKINEK